VFSVFFAQATRRSPTSSCLARPRARRVLHVKELEVIVPDLEAEGEVKKGSGQQRPPGSVLAGRQGWRVSPVLVIVAGKLRLVV
jgi:hypothetical protein